MPADATNSAADSDTGMRVSIRWAAAAAASLIALAILAPDGLLLIGFLAVVIAVHEVGHLVAARRAGMVATELCWGFGPEVWSIERGGCRYGVRAIFAGGFVRLHGMTPSAELPEGFDEAATFRAASHRDRLVTILAGPAANVALALVAFTAAAAVDGTRGPALLMAGMADAWFVASGTAEALGIWVAELGAYWQALVDPGSGVDAPVRFLSPVAQAQVSGLAVDSGWVTSLRWLGVLSVAVGVVNLLPLPPLDGAHAAVAAGEAVVQRIGRRPSFRLDVSRLLPLAYATVVALAFLSVSALVMDLRDLS